VGTFSLKPGLLIGTASAATQIEGGELDHSWMDWSRKGHIADGTSPARATGHYERIEEDAALMRDLGMQICRMGVEWARVEPREGEYDEAAIERYLEEIRLLESYGIKVLVTLHHFTNPMWFERKGAFEHEGNVTHYLRLVEKLVTAFGAQASEYITINEPNVYAANGYFFGIWPPGKKSFALTVKVMSVLAAAHIDAYRLIHKLRGEMGYTDTKVGFANHVRVFAPENPKNPAHRLYARLAERFFQGSLSKALYTGEFQFPLRRLSLPQPGTPAHIPLQGGVAQNGGAAPPVSGSSAHSDFMALNYYTRSTVSGIRDGVRRGALINDLGWEIYPQGIVECAQKLYGASPMPIYITENGTCDNSDAFRSRYLYDHLKALCESSLPIERYYHWCFCDNFEWAEGESARFGIVHTDYETQTRTTKKSGEFLREVIKAQGVDEKMYDEYIKNQRYPRNSIA